MRLVVAVLGVPGFDRRLVLHTVVAILGISLTFFWPELERQIRIEGAESFRAYSTSSSTHQAFMPTTTAPIDTIAQ